MGEPKASSPFEELELIETSTHPADAFRLIAFAIKTGTHWQVGSPRQDVQTKVTLTVNVLDEFKIAFRGTTAGMSRVIFARRTLIIGWDSVNGTALVIPLDIQYKLVAPP